MWALVKDNTVKDLYNYPKSVVIDNVRYPKNIFTLFSEEEKKKIGIYDVVSKPNPNLQFHTRGQSYFTFDKDTEVVNEKFEVTDVEINDIGKNKGLKTVEIDTAKEKAHSFIQSYSWLVERYVYDNTKAIPNEVVTYVADVRSACETICIAIKNCKTIDQFKKLFDINKETNISMINNWPNDNNVRKYRR